MTLNLTSQYYSTSRDFAVIENDPNDVAAIETTLHGRLHATQPSRRRTATIWYGAPRIPRARCSRSINGAQHSLSVENEEMSDTHVVNALVSAASRGVLVQIAMTNDDNDYSSEFKRLVAAGGGGWHLRGDGFLIHSREGHSGRLWQSGRAGVHRLGELLQRVADRESRTGVDYLRSGDHGLDLQHVDQRLHRRHALVRKQGQLLDRSQSPIRSP